MSGAKCRCVVRERQRRMVADAAGVVTVRHGKVEGCVRGELGGQRPSSVALSKGYWRCDVVSRVCVGTARICTILGKDPSRTRPHTSVGHKGDRRHRRVADRNEGLSGLCGCASGAEGQERSQSICAACVSIGSLRRAQSIRIAALLRLESTVAQTARGSQRRRSVRRAEVGEERFCRRPISTRRCFGVFPCRESSWAGSTSCAMGRARYETVGERGCFSGCRIARTHAPGCRTSAATLRYLNSESSSHGLCVSSNDFSRGRMRWSGPSVTAKTVRVVARF